MTERNEPRDHELEGEDRRIIEGLRAGLDPGPRTPAQRSAFTRALEERIARPVGSWVIWRPLVLAGGTAMAALALWLVVPLTSMEGGGEAASPTPSLLAYAYYETDYLADSGGDGLPAEYEAIASALDLP